MNNLNLIKKYKKINKLYVGGNIETGKKPFSETKGGQFLGSINGAGLASGATQLASGDTIGGASSMLGSLASGIPIVGGALSGLITGLGSIFSMGQQRDAMLKQEALDRDIKQQNALADNTDFNNSIGNKIYPDQLTTNISSHGGEIHIAKSKKGTFTAAATKHGDSVQEFASKVLANKNNYSPIMVKKANFARNAANWHAEGGKINTLNPNDDLIKIETGGTHEQNPNGGVQIGYDENGTPNTVEQGETMMNDFVYSNRIIVPSDINLRIQYNLPNSIKGMSFAKASEIINNKFKDREDSISLKTKQAFLDRLSALQEQLKQAEQDAIQQQIGVQPNIENQAIQDTQLEQQIDSIGNSEKVQQNASMMPQQQFGLGGDIVKILDTPKKMLMYTKVLSDPSKVAELKTKGIDVYSLDGIKSVFDDRSDNYLPSNVLLPGNSSNYIKSTVDGLVDPVNFVGGVGLIKGAKALNGISKAKTVKEALNSATKAARYKSTMRNPTTYGKLFGTSIPLTIGTQSYLNKKAKDEYNKNAKEIPIEIYDEDKILEQYNNINDNIVDKNSNTFNEDLINSGIRKYDKGGDLNNISNKFARFQLDPPFNSFKNPFKDYNIKKQKEVNIKQQKPSKINLVGNGKYAPFEFDKKTDIYNNYIPDIHITPEKKVVPDYDSIINKAIDDRYEKDLSKIDNSRALNAIIGNISKLSMNKAPDRASYTSNKLPIIGNLYPRLTDKKRLYDAIDRSAKSAEYSLRNIGGSNPNSIMSNLGSLHSKVIDTKANTALQNEMSNNNIKSSVDQYNSNIAQKNLVQNNQLANNDRILFNNAKRDYDDTRASIYGNLFNNMDQILQGKSNRKFSKQMGEIYGRYSKLNDEKDKSNKFGGLIKKRLK